MSKHRSHGEGTIYFSETHNRWVAQISLPSGKRRIKSGKTQKEVKDWLLMQRRALADNLHVANGKVTHGEIVDQFLEDIVKHTLLPKKYWVIFLFDQLTYIPGPRSH